MKALFIVPSVWIAVSVPLGLLMARLLRASREAGKAGSGRAGLGRQRIGIDRRRTGNPVIPVVSIVAIVLAALAAAATTTAELATTAAPGSTLWGVRLRLEALRVAVQPDERSRAMVHLRFAAERATQIVELSGEGRADDVAVLAGNLREHLSKAQSSLPQLRTDSSAFADRLRERGFETVRHEIQVLSQVVTTTCNDAPTAECPALQSALSTSNRLLVALAPTPPPVVGLSPVVAPPPTAGPVPEPPSPSLDPTEAASTTPPILTTPPIATQSPVDTTGSPDPSPTDPSPTVTSADPTSSVPSPSPSGSSTPTTPAPPPTTEPPAPAPAPTAPVPSSSSTGSASPAPNTTSPAPSSQPG